MAGAGRGIGQSCKSIARTMLNVFIYVHLAIILFGIVTITVSGSCYFHSETLPLPMYSHQGIYSASKNAVYLFGGRTGTTWSDRTNLNKIYKWDLNDPSSGFVEIGTTPSEATLFVSWIQNAVLVDDQVLFIGIERDGWSSSGKIFVYDLNTESFLTEPGDQKSEMPVPSFSGCVTTNATHIFMVDGRDATTAPRLPIIHVYDIAADTWQSQVLDAGPIIATGWRQQSCSLVGDALYVMGGVIGNVYFDDIYRINTRTLEIQQLEVTLPSPQTYGASIYDDDQNLYLFGSWPLKNDVLEFNLNTLSVSTAFSSQQFYVAAPVLTINGSIYRFGGCRNESDVSYYAIDKVEICDLPTDMPTSEPSLIPTQSPTKIPSSNPTLIPPTLAPSTGIPTRSPTTVAPTKSPTIVGAAVSYTDWTQARDALQVVKANWQANGLTSYIYNVRTSCSCQQCDTVAKYVEINEDGAPIYVGFDEEALAADAWLTSWCGNTQLLTPFVDNYHAIEWYFNEAITWAQQGIDHCTAAATCFDNFVCDGSITLAYDEVLFFPTQISLTTGNCVADGGSSWYIDCVTQTVTTDSITSPVNTSTACKLSNGDLWTRPEVGDDCGLPPDDCAALQCAACVGCTDVQYGCCNTCTIENVNGELQCGGMIPQDRVCPVTTTMPTSAIPSPAPTHSPTKLPTKTPTSSPTWTPTSVPSNDPTKQPTKSPTKSPSPAPTVNPTQSPTANPTQSPTSGPTIDPTTDPTYDPTRDPTSDPTKDPTYDPNAGPTFDPTRDPARDPTSASNQDPTKDPTRDPTLDPTMDPSRDPTSDPTIDTTADPTRDPTSPPSNSEFGVDTTIKIDAVLSQTETDELITALYDYAKNTANTTNCSEQHIDVSSQQAEDDSKTVIKMSIVTCSEATEKLLLVAFDQTVLEYDIIGGIVTEAEFEEIEIEIEGIYDSKTESDNDSSTPDEDFDWFVVVLVVLLVLISGAMVRKCYVERKIGNRLDELGAHQNDNANQDPDVVSSSKRGSHDHSIVEPGALSTADDSPVPIACPGSEEKDQDACGMQSSQESEMAPVVTSGGYEQDNIADDEFVVEEDDYREMAPVVTAGGYVQENIAADEFVVEEEDAEHITTTAGMAVTTSGAEAGEK